MNKLLLAALCGCAMLQGAEVSVPIERFKLANGLRVIVSSDKTVPATPQASG